MDTFVCQKCGYIAFKNAPDNCPVCWASKENFKLDANAIKKPVDPKNLNEMEKKHIPSITIVKECKLLGPGCIDAKIKIGEILHVMEAKHFITYIDIYHNYDFIARYHMVAEKLNPSIIIHLKVSTGKLTVLENCNVHGRWTAESEI